MHDADEHPCVQIGPVAARASARYIAPIETKPSEELSMAEKTNPHPTDTITFVAWLNGWRGGDWAPLISSRVVGQCEMNFGDNDTLHYTWNNDSSATWGWTGGPVIPRDTWTMLAVTIDPASATAYVYTDDGGLVQSTNKRPTSSTEADPSEDTTSK